tara:strand:+ start:32513 stop:33214 length:702 start_codon:yes stop_codon:yes gene_type:complete
MYADLIQQIEALLSQSAAPVSLIALGVNLALGLLLSLVLRWHYGRYASCLANRADLARTFPLIVLATILIITIVKSSLALSLGLVGALSIVRFRTPIKEPEELAYLFLAISVGLGMGAGQGLATIFAIAIILTAAGFLGRNRSQSAPGGVFVTATWDGKNMDPGVMKSAHTSMMQFATDIDIRRMDMLKDRLEMVALVDLTKADLLPDMLTELQHAFPEVEISVVDQQQIPGV